MKVESPSLLTGLIQDGDGNKLTASHAVKNARRYRYYCQAVTQRGAQQGGPIRLPAHDIESRVIARIAAFLESEDQVMDHLGIGEDSAGTIERLLVSAANTSRALKQGTHGQISELVRNVVHGVVVHPQHVEVRISKKDLRGALVNERSTEQLGGQIVCLEFAARRSRLGREVRLIVSPAATETAPAYQSKALLKAIARAHDWREQLVTGRASGPRGIAKQTGLDESYVRRILGCAFLAPDIVESILDGRQPHDLTLEKLRARMPMSWNEQHSRILRPA